MLKSDRQHLILASSSPRRQELIRTLNIPFEIRVSDVDETTPTFWSPAQVVEQLALRKAEKVRETLQAGEQGIIIGADTIVVQDYRVLGKPKDDNDAIWMIGLLQGKTHQVYSGVACIDAASGETHVSHRITYVTMKHLTDQQIANYVASGEPRDKAGAYAIQGLGATIVESIEGCYFNVVGLPLSLLSDMLAKFGVEVL
ncbi:septum formation protein Maf [Paenibacillus selenitireducens]|uniref:dTTP/UTP pyrophosphatase n=1 Tax=Paenibacillus selenitireducens TaxID=1324314 RepID=A0A1T2XKZ7_9BACL|nr:Maf family protein [Paenibacillus selenitireducens]OPA80343.1 septum formation protein Maf [Paenibacillus selenitireducens]